MEFQVWGVGFEVCQEIRAQIGVFRVRNSGFRVPVLGVMGQGVGFRVKSLGFRVEGVQNKGFRVECFGSRVQVLGLGFRVQGNSAVVP